MLLIGSKIKTMVCLSGKNRPSTDAALKQGARTEFAILEGSHAVSMLADLIKIFEAITLAVL